MTSPKHSKQVVGRGDGHFSAPKGTEVGPAERAGTAVNPATGEALVLGSTPTDVLGRALDEIRDMESRAKEFKLVVSAEILARMDVQASWTTRMGAYKLTGDSPAKHGYDVDRLRDTLEDMVRDGLVSQEAATQGIKTEVVYSAKAAGLAALGKLSPEVAAKIKECEVPQTRYVKVVREETVPVRA